MTVTTITDAELTPQHYASDQEVRWCPGGGDYAILNAVHKALADLGAGGRFVARAVDTQQADVVAVLKRAHAHRGASFVEVFQNCVVFNDGVFDQFTSKDVASDAQLHVEHGKPLLFGSKRDRGLRLKPGTVALEVVPVGEGGVPPGDILVHDETNRALAQLLVALEPPAFPVALGVLHCNPAASYEAEVYAQAQAAGFSGEPADLGALLRREGTWTVAP